MLVISEEKLSLLKENKYKVYSKEPLIDGIECFKSSESFSHDEKFYITSVPINNIKHHNGKFVFTTEDLSTYADWFPASVIKVQNHFSPCKKVKSHIGKVIKSDKCLVDVSQLPAFNTLANEDYTVNEYRFYLTLFNDYTVKQCKYDRHDLHDAMFKSSKYDLASKIQNSNFLKSKDFKMINYKRQNDESVKVGLVIKEADSTKYSVEYADVYINMENKISVVWQ